MKLSLSNHPDTLVRKFQWGKVVDLFSGNGTVTFTQDGTEVGSGMQTSI